MSGSFAALTKSRRKLDKDLQGLILPWVEQCAHRRCGEQQPKEVAPLCRNARESEDLICSRVPSQHIPAKIEDVRRTHWEVGHQPMNERWHDTPGFARLWRVPMMRQQKKMPSFGGVQLQRARQIFEESRRYADLSPLLQPGVPGQSYPGENCDFLPSKPRSPPSCTRRQASTVSTSCCGAISFEGSSSSSSMLVPSLFVAMSVIQSCVIQNG